MLISCLSVYLSSWREFNGGVVVVTLVALCHVYHATHDSVPIVALFTLKFTHSDPKLLPDGAGFILYSTVITGRVRIVIWYHLMPPLHVKTPMGWFTVGTAELPTVFRASTSPPPTSRHLGFLCMKLT